MSFGTKLKNYKMKKIFFLLISVVVLSSCKQDKSIDQNFYGHWMNKDFYDQVMAKKNINEFTAPLTEFIINENDTNFSLITIGKKTKTGPFEPFEKEHIVLKNFFGANHNADVILNNNQLELINPYTEEKVVFVKLNDQEYDKRLKELSGSYAIALVNRTYISGMYANDTSKVNFKESGEVKGLGNFINYSFCFSSDCRSTNSNSIFLSNERYEGNYYEYEFKKDSLIIYDIDEIAVSRGLNGGRNGIKFQLKKTN